MTVSNFPCDMWFSEGRQDSGSFRHQYSTPELNVTPQRTSEDLCRCALLPLCKIFNTLGQTLNIILFNSNYTIYLQDTQIVMQFLPMFLMAVKRKYTEIGENEEKKCMKDTQPESVGDSLLDRQVKYTTFTSIIILRLCW